MGRTPSVSAVLLFLALSSNLARGQSARGAESPVGPGSRLRITAPSISMRPLVGTLVESRQEGIVISLSDSERRAIPRSDIIRVERSEGRRRHAAQGALIGAATALAVVAVAAESGGEAILMSPILGAGAVAGVGIGAVVRTERWTEVPSSDLRLTLRPTRGRGVAAALTWSW